MRDGTIRRCSFGLENPPQQTEHFEAKRAERLTTEEVAT